MFLEIKKIINGLDTSIINADRINLLQILIDFIQEKKNAKQLISLNFICPHNSRRSHLSQIWAQTLATYYTIPNVFCYSGGTEATAMFPVVGKILQNQGFDVEIISGGNNPIHTIKYSTNTHPIIGFSKTFDNTFNPQNNFAAIMTCSSADEGCPFIAGASKRIPLTFDDPKAFDNTPEQVQKYTEKSLQIAMELKYVFSKIR